MEAFLADVLVSIHFCIVSFCVLGEALILVGWAFKWAWVRNLAFRIAHLCTVLYVAGEAVVGVPCPLTEWEYLLRRKAGQRYDEEMSFVARLIRKIIFYDFPPWVFTALYVGFGILVLVTFIMVRPRRRKRGS